MAGCGCGGSSGGRAGTAGRWEVTKPDGRTVPYATEWEARQAANTSGGTYAWVTS